MSVSPGFAVTPPTQITAPLRIPYPADGRIEGLH